MQHIKYFENFKEHIDDKCGKEFWFEYHCYESPASSDAEVWYRSHQKCLVLAVTELGGGDTPIERGENGEPRCYKVRFADGFEYDVFEDELMNDPSEFYRPDPPKKIIYEHYRKYDKKDDILPNDFLLKIKEKLKFKSFKRIDSGKFGTAFKVSPTKVFKISKDLMEYKYAKNMIGNDYIHIANIYAVYHWTYNNEQYVGILKEYCMVDEYYFDEKIDKFLEYTGKEMSLSYIASEYLYGDISKKQLDKYFNIFYKNYGDSKNWFANQFYNMILELKTNKIYVKDFNGSNIGIKIKTNNLCMLELGLGYWNDIKFLDKNDYLYI